MTITRLPSAAGSKCVARMAAASVALASVAALAVAGVTERAAVAASFGAISERAHFTQKGSPACVDDVVAA